MAAASNRSTAAGAASADDERHSLVAASALDLLLRAGQPMKARIEGRQIFLEHSGCMALRIDGDKDHVETICVLAKTVQRARQAGQGCGADVGTSGIAEEQNRRLADEESLRHGPVVLVACGEWATDALRTQGTGC